MKIGFLIWAGSSFGGVQRRYSRLANEIAKSRSDLQVVIISHRQASVVVLNLFDTTTAVEFHSFGAGGHKESLVNIVKNLLSLRKKLKGLKLDHLHLCESPSFLSVLTAIATPASFKLTLSFVDSIYNERVNKFERFTSAISLFRFSKIDCLSAGVAKECARFFPSHSFKQEVAPCSFSDYSKVENAEKRDIDIAMVARFEDGKGYDLLESIADNMADWSVHLCGFGPRPPRIFRSNIQIYQTDNPFHVLSRTKIFLSLQRFNNYPSQSLLEAMASGCAVIATDVGETKILLDDTCAILVPYNSLDLLNAVKKLMSDLELRSQLGTAAREKVLASQTALRYTNYFCEKILEV